MKTVRDIMTYEPKVISEDETVIKALNVMRDHNISQLPVLSGKSYIGMISYRDLAGRKSIHFNSKIRHFISSSPVLKPDDDINKALDLLKKSAMGALAVVDGNKLLGVVSRTDIIKNISEFPEVNLYSAQDIMDEPLSVHEDQDISLAIEKMREKGLDIVAVIDKDEKISGILKMKEVLDYELKTREKQNSMEMSGNKEKADIIVKSVMSNPHFVYEEDKVITGCESIVKEKVHSIPVVNKGMKVTGMLTINNVLDVIGNEGEEKGIMVNISGLSQNDKDLYLTTYSMCEKFFNRLEKIVNLKGGSFQIHVAKHKENEGKIKYSVRTRLLGRKLNMTVDSYGWNYARTLSDIFDIYETRIKKEFSK
ncbi:CBS domain-containing protein [Caldiplasma sukawensis]